MKQLPSLPPRDYGNIFECLLASQWLHYLSKSNQIILSGLKYDKCLCYFDNIIILLVELEQQCERLELVLCHFQQHNLCVKASKCCFGADKVTYLSHVILAAGIQTDPKKIKTVTSLKQPENVEQVQSFLGLAGYYRNFIPNFATLSALLVQVTKEGSKFLWTSSFP